MAIASLPKRLIRENTFDIDGYAETAFETLATETVWLDSLTVTNEGTTDATLRVTDNQGTPRALQPNLIIPASATNSELSGLLANGTPIRLIGGLRIQASAANQLYVRGSYSR